MKVSNWQNLSLPILVIETYTLSCKRFFGDCTLGLIGSFKILLTCTYNRTVLIIETIEYPGTELNHNFV